MTPSPPTPKLRSQSLAAWSGVRIGSGAWRLSTFFGGRVGGGFRGGE
jgi:hypothetical protein